MTEFLLSFVFAGIVVAILVGIWPTLPFWGAVGGAWVLYWVGICLFKMEKGDLNIDLGDILP